MSHAASNLQAANHKFRKLQNSYYYYYSLWTCSPEGKNITARRNLMMFLLTQTDVVAEHVQDALTALPFVPAAVTRAPLGHFCAAVAHIVGSHDSAWS